MTSADRNDLVSTEEKLEWVTPTISLMGAVTTAAGKNSANSEILGNLDDSLYVGGPS